MKRRTKTVTLAALVAASFLLGVLVFYDSPGQQAVAQAPAGQAPAQQPATQPAQPAQDEAKPAQIDKNSLLILIRSILLTLDQANKTGNYTVLRDIGSPQFQAANTASRLGEIFAWQRNAKLDLSGVAVLEPQITLGPQIEKNGLLHFAGFFPSVPTQIRFEMAFAPVAGQWKLFGIGMSLGQANAAAPPPSPPLAPGDASAANKGFQKPAESADKNLPAMRNAPKR